MLLELNRARLTSNDSCEPLRSHVSIPEELWNPYLVAEIIIALTSVVGNALVIFVFWKYQLLRKNFNYYIVSLSDFLLGILGIPYSVLISMGEPRNLYGCLFGYSVILLLNLVTILSILAISFDRYWAILFPYNYKLHMSRTFTIGILASCWMAGAIVAFLPMFGWYNKNTCFSLQADYPCTSGDVLTTLYVDFFYLFEIPLPSILLIFFYGSIFRVILLQLTKTNSQSLSILDELRATKKITIIILFFVVCYYPTFTIAILRMCWPGLKVSRKAFNGFVIMTHINSGVNPFMYALSLDDFRSCLKKTYSALRKAFFSPCPAFLQT